LVLVLLPLVVAFAEDKYTKSKEPVFFDVQPDHALVYFARPNSTRITLNLFVDDKPIGWLPPRSYVSAQLEPGSRVVWQGIRKFPGPSSYDSRRFDFQAGKTYLLILVEKYDPQFVGSSWESGNPADVQLFVKDQRLVYVKSNEEEMGKLREEAAKRFEKEAKQAPEVHAAVLPATFEKVWYRTGKRGFAWRPYDATGTLAVNGETIEYKSEKENFSIPVKDVQAVSMDAFTGFVNSGDEAPWGMVRFTRNGNEEIAAFSDRNERGGTERIFLTLRSAVKTSAPAPPPQTASAMRPDAVSFPQPPIKTGEIGENQQYKSAGGMFTVTVPPARNPFVRIYKLSETKRKQGDADYEEVAFNIQDFGQTYGAGVHRIPPAVLAKMSEEEQKQTLSNLAGITVSRWRNYAEEPRSAEESPVQTQFGAGLFRMYVARHSSLLARMTGTDASGKRLTESSDARIAVLVVKKGNSYIHAVAEDEYPGAGSQPLDLRKQLEAFLASMTVLEQKEPPQGETPAPQLPDSSVAAQSPAVAAASPTPAVEGLPEGFVLYEGSKEQFTIGLPKDWTAYDQGKMMKAAGLERMGRFSDMIIFYQSKDSTRTLLESPELMGKVDTGELPSFFLQKQHADKGMACNGFSEKAAKQAMDSIAKDPEFKGKNAVEAAHGEPADVGGCKGLRIRAKGQRSSGTTVVADAYAASDGVTLYMFSLRNPADNYAKNADTFQKAISTLKFSVAK
jgi:hypothetical protein